MLLRLAALLILAACQTPPQPFYPPASDAAPASRRLSACRFEVGFSPDSTAISDDAHRIIEQAVAEAQRRGARTVTIAAPYVAEGGSSGRGGRLLAVMEDLERSGLARRNMSASAINNAPVELSVVITVCGLSSEAHLSQQIPADPNRLVTARAFGTVLRIPLRYLGPSVWQDFPFLDVQNLPALYFGWPGLQDRMSAVMRSCPALRLQDCPDAVHVTLVAPGTHAEEVRQQLSPGNKIRVPGELHGVQWSVYRNWRERPEAIFQGRAADGAAVAGSCRFRDWPPSIPADWQSTRDGVHALLARSRTFCRMVIALGDKLEAEVIFGANHVTDWTAIRASLIYTFQRFGAAPLN
ncbi:hypothetical protein [Roseomonas sp. WA12]